MEKIELIEAYTLKERQSILDNKKIEIKDHLMINLNQIESLTMYREDDIFYEIKMVGNEKDYYYVKIEEITKYINKNN